MKNLLTLIAIFALATGAFADSGEDTNGTYFFADSAESFGPTYSWVDASSGTDLGFGDDDNYAANTPFDIMFYGATFTSGTAITVGCNGAISLNPGADIYYGSTLPHADDAENVIAVWWYDMRGYDSTDSHLYSYSTTIGGENAWVLSYVNWYAYYHTPTYGPFDFQIIIFETDGTHESKILLQYNDTTSDDDAHYDNGYEAYAGIENNAGDLGHMYSDSTDANLTASLAVRYADTGALLNAFDLLTPVDGATIPVIDKSSGDNARVNETKADEDVTFTWDVPDNMGPGTISYLWECDDDVAFGSVDYDATVSAATHTETFSVTADETWYWRVIATESEYSGTKVCTDVFDFEFDWSSDIKSASLGTIKAEFK